MNSKQLVLDALYNKEVERIPWVPFVGCHAASLINADTEEYFKNADLIVKGVTRAYELYQPDGLPALFDLQLEAEAMGCKLIYAKDNPPAVSSHILEEGVQLKDLKVPTEKDGRFPVALEATRRIVKALGEKIAIYGLITGPFTLALHLKGTEIFYEMLDEPDDVKSLMEFCKKVCINTARMYMEAGCDIIAVVDPMTSQISPDNFDEFVTPYVSSVMEYIREQKKGSSFFVCGNAKRNIEVMCRTKPDNISIDENIPLEYVIETCKPYGVSVGGNIKLTLTMLFGSRMDNVNDAKNCMTIGGTKGFILSPGCDMPYATPIENVKAITSTVLGNMTDIFDENEVLNITDYELPDYSNEKQVIVDCITLDSESCAACQYTMEAVLTSALPLGDKVKVIEHKIKQKEGIACMLKLGATNVPTIVVDGIIKYVSILPDNTELTACFKAAADLKRNKYLTGEN
ncbi:uroporphyrinogen decarboxylase [Anaerocolumna sedimenticola]|uniref:Uroporphyrinogen decarboxylase n=1 Tax=Anaerocolumna sedimenticola TaxID=2696063 RepID=A0A6P1TUH3_9FIRM|nr:uroporphyrinogen decarboxylase family protein [Anaerocolumna sedimenticola]QHQ63138.1 uroporphyrinogen decarboxylase [Anaerocolumna sedimenticola]